MLSDSDSEPQDLHTLTINEHFAKAFEYKKEREELVKLKEKYGSDYSESGFSDADNLEDEEDTEEDTDGEELTPAMDAAILRTLARIRKKDPAIYEGGRRVFEEEHARTQDKAPARNPKGKEKMSKPLTIREAALASVLADADPYSRSASPAPDPLTHSEEQALLRSETRAAFHGAVDSEDQGDHDDLLVPRSRSRDKMELEEEEYKTFLEREVGEDIHGLVMADTSEVLNASDGVDVIKDAEREQEGKRKKKKGKKEREREKEANREKTEPKGKKTEKRRDKESKEAADKEFLMNYILNRGWVDRSSRRVPTYNEIVDSASPRQSQHKSPETHPRSGSEVGARQDLDDEQGRPHTTLSDEDSFDDLADAFETSYNFRFEELGGGLIASYPRNVTSVRRESTTRKDARTRKWERQEAEKQGLLQARREEIRKERALAVAAIAEENPNECILVNEDNMSNRKKSKRQQRREELARLRALKANELRRKLEMVSSEGGLDSFEDETLAHLDLDAEWDPSKHDAQMAELYAGYDEIADDDARKPVWDDDISINDIEPTTNAKWKAELKKQRKKDKKKNKKQDECEDGGVDIDEMDADLDVATNWEDSEDDGEGWKGTEKDRKRKVDAYMDEVVNRLGFSGITSHIPTRFHYTSTASENYGLTPVEILLSTDAELNSYVGLKKLAPYRIDRGKKNWDPKRVERLKEFRENLHTRVGSRYEGAWSFDTSTHSKGRGISAEKKKRKGKKERAKLRAVQGEDGNEDESNAGVQDQPVSKSEKRKRDPESHAPPTSEAEGSREKKRRRHKKRSGEGGETED